MEYEEIKLHGHVVTFRRAGWGPVILLIHGVTGSSETWEDVMEPLAERYTVVAPDLLGHGRSAKPRGDYSLGAYASGVRDLLSAIGHDRATIVGHSLGGGVAMQLAYQFPERCERLVLVSSGGLGKEVNALLRAATLPGSEWVLPFLAAPGVIDATSSVAAVAGRFGLRAAPDIQEMWRGFASLSEPGARGAFIHTLRSLIDVSGQRVSARDRLYLAQNVPTLLMWGERDPIIPVQHGLMAHRAIPGSRFETFPSSGHFLYLDDPGRFVRILTDFIETTEPATMDDARWRELLRGEDHDGG